LFYDPFAIIGDNPVNGKSDLPDADAVLNSGCAALSPDERLF
jgi:hypothetical protein